MIYKNILSLLIGSSLFQMGTGMLNTLVGLRAAELGFSSLQAGLIMSAFFLGFLLGIIFLPPLVARVGHIRAYASFAAAAAGIILLHGLYYSPELWGILRFMAGVCAAGFSLVLESWLNVAASNRERGGVFSTYVMLNLLAIGFSQILLYYDRQGGVAPFAIAAFFAVISIIPVALTYIGEPSRGHAEPKGGIGFLWQNAPLALAGVLASGFASGSFWGMTPYYLQKIGYDPRTAAFIMSAIIFGAPLLQWPIGRLSDRFDRRLFIAGAGGASALLAIVVGLAGYTLNPYMLIAGFFYGGTAFSIYALCVAHANDYIPPAHRLSAASSLINMFGWGALLGPVLSGIFMAQLGPAGLLWFVSAVFVILAAYSIYRINVRLPAPEDRKSHFFPMASSSKAALDLDPRLREVKESTDAGAAERKEV